MINKMAQWANVRPFICLVLAFSLTLCECNKNARTPVIKTKYGPMQGLVLSTVWHSMKYSAFKSVPFAKPPIGELRFKPPVPPNPWTEVLNATEEVNVCPQIDPYNPGYIGQEDCLYMNLYTPELEFKENMPKRAVMVWFLSGTFVQGSASAELYGPDFLVEQDVVLVIPNHRLGVLGFLYLDHPEAMGNAALKDQNMVLRWVRDNIVAFGGDPDRVTIFGESAGSGSVNFHLLSPMSKGLFHRSIHQSGTSLALLYHPPEVIYQTAHALAAYLGFQGNDTKQLLDFYMHADAKQLVEASNKFLFLPANSTVAFSPTKENVKLGQPVFLPECPITLIQTGAFEKNPMMMGFTYNEDLVFTFKPFEDLRKIEDAINKIRRELYLGNMAFNNLPIDYFIANLTFILSQITNVGPVDLTQRLFTKLNDGLPIYYYQISYNTPYQFHNGIGVPLNESVHTDDLGFLFHSSIYYSPDDIHHPLNQFRQKMAKLWTNFAKYGNPTPLSHNPLGDVIWLPSGRAGLIMNMNDEFTMIPREKSVIGLLGLLTGEVLYFLLPFISCCDKISYAVDFFSIYP